MSGDEYRVLLDALDRGKEPMVVFNFRITKASRWVFHRVLAAGADGQMIVRQDGRRVHTHRRYCDLPLIA